MFNPLSPAWAILSVSCPSALGNIMQIPSCLPHNIALLRGLALRSRDGASTGAGILLYNHAISLIGGLSKGNLDPPIGRLRAQQTGTTKYHILLDNYHSLLSTIIGSVVNLAANGREGREKSSFRRLQHSVFAQQTAEWCPFFVPVPVTPPLPGFKRGKRLNGIIVPKYPLNLTTCVPREKPNNPPRRRCRRQ